MKKYLILVLIVLIIGTLVIGVQAVGKGVTKSTGKDAAAMIPAVEMYPGSKYDNIYQIPGAKGKVNMIQPNGNVDVILGVSADGLIPDSRYKVWFDTNGVSQGEISTAGPWKLMGEFWTDEYGYGEWNYTAPAGSLEEGLHTLAVAINRTVPIEATVLISFNVEFVIVVEQKHDSKEADWMQENANLVGIPKKQGKVLCFILKEDFSIFFSLFKMNSSKAWILIY